MKLLYEIISLFNHDYMLKLSLKINDGYLVNNHLFKNLEKKIKNKKSKKGYKVLRRNYCRGEAPRPIEDWERYSAALQHIRTP